MNETETKLSDDVYVGIQYLIAKKERDLTHDFDACERIRMNLCIKFFASLALSAKECRWLAEMLNGFAPELEKHSKPRKASSTP